MFKIEQNKEIPSKGAEKTGDNSEEEEDEEKAPSEDEDGEDADDDDNELRTGSSKLLLTAVGIGYHNLTKTLI